MHSHGNTNCPTRSHIYLDSKPKILLICKFVQCKGECLPIHQIKKGECLPYAGLASTTIWQSLKSLVPLDFSLIPNRGAC